MLCGRRGGRVCRSGVLRGTKGGGLSRSLGMYAGAGHSALAGESLWLKWRHHNGQMQPYGTRKATLVHAYGCCRSGSGLRVRLTGVWAIWKKNPYGCFKFLTGPSYGSFKHPYGTFKHPYKSFQTPVRHTPVRRTPVRQHKTPVRQNETPVKRTRKTSYYSRKKDP